MEKTPLELIIKKFKQNKIKSFYNTATQTNDGGVRVGQIYYANFYIRNDIF